MSDKLKTLSDAILLGSTFRPKCKGVMFNVAGASCALGAAYEACTGETDKSEDEIEFYLRDRFNMPQTYRDRWDEDPIHKVMCMNDGGGLCTTEPEFTREEIAAKLKEEGL